MNAATNSVAACVEKIREAEKDRDAWAARGVVFDQAARTIDLLYFSPYTKVDSNNKVTTTYTAMLDKTMFRLFEGWSKKHHLLQASTAKTQEECPICFSPNPDSSCPACTTALRARFRPLWMAALYLHRLLLAGTVTEHNMDVAIISCLLLALKIQMPTVLSWGVSVCIELVTGIEASGKRLDSSVQETLLKIRGQVVKFEHKVVQTVGERSLRALLPMDHVGAAVQVIFGKPPEHLETDAELIRANRRHIVYRTAVRFCEAIFKTVAPVTCDALEIANSLVWLAWRCTCSCPAEVEIGEPTVLSKLDLNASVEHTLQLNNTPLSLLQTGILFHGDKLWLDVYPTPLATVSYAEGTVTYLTHAGPSYPSLRALTMALPEAHLPADKIITDMELLARWKVRRGLNLFSLGAMLEGWPRFRRLDVLSKVIPIEEGPSKSERYTCKAIFEVTFWMMHQWLRTSDWVHFQRLRHDAESPGTHCIRMALQQLIATGHIDTSQHDDPTKLGLLLSSLPPPQLRVNCLPDPSWALFEAPSSKSAMVGALPHGMVVGCLDIVGQWANVRYNHIAGWACMLNGGVVGLEPLNATPSLHLAPKEDQDLGSRKRPREERTSSGKKRRANA